MDEIRESAQENKTTAGKQVIRNIICGRIVKKYRLSKAMAGATKLARNSLMRSTSGPLKKMDCGWKERVFSVLLRLPFLSAKPTTPSS